MSCRATPAHASEPFEWRIRQRSRYGSRFSEAVRRRTALLPVRLYHEKSKREVRKVFVIASGRRPRGNPVNQRRPLMSFRTARSRNSE